MRPSLFLDFDGVIAWNIRAPIAQRFRRECIERLNELVRVADPIVIASTSWRVHHSVERMEGFLKAAGYTDIGLTDADVRRALVLLGSRT